MADEKSIVKMNKMIHKKTGASFLVVYVALCIQIARKVRHFYSSDIPTLQLLEGNKMLTCTHTRRFISVPLCSGQSELASICLFVQFNNQLDV